MYISGNSFRSKALDAAARFRFPHSGMNEETLIIHTDSVPLSTRLLLLIENILRFTRLFFV